jgi:uncharacterized phage infection (PIP) family protein YhgE
MRTTYAAASAALAAVLIGTGCTSGSSSETSAQLAALQSQVAELQKQAQKADDYVAIANLQSIYGYYVDKSRWDDAADLFSANATLEIAGRGLFTGQARIREYLNQLGPLERVHAGGASGQGGALG